MRTAFIYDNSHRRTEIIAGLKKGDKLICIKSTTTLDDLGFSGIVFETEGFIKDKEYEVHETYFWSGANVAYVQQEDGSLTWATPDIFELKEN